MALPPGARPLGVRVLEGPAGATARLTGVRGHIRGLTIASFEVDGPVDGALRVRVDHDGDWSRSADSRLRRYSRSFDELFGIAGATLGRDVVESENGVYLIVCADAYLDALDPLVDWKRRKGFRVEVAPTSVTGGTAAEIQAWVRDAYATWDIPPEYLLLVGDVDVIPHFLLSDATDNPYSLMDDEDWLPDLLLGRISVESLYQAQTAINKTVAYEREPDNSNPDWFKSYLGVATNHGSATPIHTVNWGMSHLAGKGWHNGHVVNPDYFDLDDPEHPVSMGHLLAMESQGGVFDPFVEDFMSVPQINGSIDNGLSVLFYRGWAINVDGWDMPRYISDHVPGLNNGRLNPVVLSFVCDTGCYSYGDRPCMGEAWVRAGSPTEQKGAVAFVGNTVFWSHTRYNDAMAISFLERLCDDGVTDLGRWMLAARTRFAEYWPHLQDYAEHGVESAEFYVSVYNLLGDPELNMHRDDMATMNVDHYANIFEGANVFSVSVTDADGTTPLAGARVGVVQGDTWIGCGFTDGSGLATVLLDDFVAGTDLDVTVTCPDRFPAESTVSAIAAADANIALDGFTIDDTVDGNGDGVVNPGETIDITATLRNAGGATAENVSTALNGFDQPVTVIVGASTAADIAAGGTADIATPYQVQVDAAVEDGRRIHLAQVVEHEASDDLSVLSLTVAAPHLTASSFTLHDDGWVMPGRANDIVIELTNAGHADGTGGTATLTLEDPTLGEVGTAVSAYPAIAVAGSAVNATAFVVTLNAAVPANKVLPFTLSYVDDAGFEQEIGFTLAAGVVNPTAPVGPDAFGYYAYDNTDLFYTESPTYTWREISPTYGGDGDEIVFVVNDELEQLVLPFDFDYYGETYDVLQVADDGWVTFDTEDFFSFYNWGLPNEHGLHSIVAPFWDNFDPTLAGYALIDGVYSKYFAAEHLLVIEWSRLRSLYEDLPDLQTFQLVLHDPAYNDGESVIEFMYRQVNNNDHLRSYATIGIEDQTEQIGLELSYGGDYATGMAPVCPGLAVRLTTRTPVYAPLLLDGFVAEPAAEGLRLSWTHSDERPILGWRLYRVEDGVDIQVGGDLPPHVMSVVDGAADLSLDNEYRLTALHPYDLKSELGPWHSLTDLNTSLRLALAQNLPNPMTADSRIDYILPEAAHVSLKVYDVTGRLVRSLVDGIEPAGQGSAVWDGKGGDGHGVAAGVYFYRLETGGRTLTRKLMLIR